MNPLRRVLREGTPQSDGAIGGELGMRLFSGSWFRSFSSLSLKEVLRLRTEPQYAEVVMPHYLDDYATQSSSGFGAASPGNFQVIFPTKNYLPNRN